MRQGGYLPELYEDEKKIYLKFFLKSPGRVIGPSQRHLPDNTQKSQKTGIHYRDRIRTRNPTKARGRRPLP